MSTRVRHVNIVMKDQSLLRNPGYRVITSSAQLNSAFPGAQIKEPVSLDRYFLICVNQGLCPTGGYHVKIAELRPMGHDICIRVVTKEPAPEDFVTLAATYPMDAVVLKKRQVGPSGRYRAFFVKGDCEVAMVPFEI